jgi:DNA adenine methylase
MPPHTRYVEPFAGSLKVLLAEDPTGVTEIVNDLDSRIANLWQVIKDEESFERFERLAKAVRFGKEAFVAAASYLYDPDPVRRALAFLIRNRMSRQALGRCFATPTSRLRRSLALRRPSPQGPPASL